MTDKRFTLTNPKNAFQEMKCGIDDRGNTLTFNEVVDLLNEQHETIQSLISDSENALLEKENEQLKQQSIVLNDKIEFLETILKETDEDVFYATKKITEQMTLQNKKGDV